MIALTGGRSGLDSAILLVLADTSTGTLSGHAIALRVAPRATPNATTNCRIVVASVAQRASHTAHVAMIAGAGPRGSRRSDSGHWIAARGAAFRRRATHHSGSPSHASASFFVIGAAASNPHRTGRDVRCGDFIAVGAGAAAQVVTAEPEYTGQDRIENWRDKTVLVVTLHPDDEAFSAGGLLAGLAAAGNNVQILIYTTDNAGSNDPTMTRERRAAIRHREEEEACAVLGIAKDHITGLAHNQWAIVHLWPITLIPVFLTPPPSGYSGITILSTVIRQQLLKDEEPVSSKDSTNYGSSP